MSIFKKLIRKATTAQDQSIKIKYPKAISYPDMPLMSRGGTYKNNFPQGAIVHFTGGWSNQKGRDAVEWANQNGYRYFIILEDGTVVQQFDLSGYGAHAGVSKCPRTGRTTVSQYYVGIEICCEGKLTKENVTDFGVRIPTDRVRSGVINNIWQKESGSFETFTQAQETSLKELLHWLCENGMAHEHIYGHDEVAPDRKDDPGLSLSITMDDLRRVVQNSL